jgi:ATP-dependent Lon protease
VGARTQPSSRSCLCCQAMNESVYVAMSVIRLFAEVIERILKVRPNFGSVALHHLVVRFLGTPRRYGTSAGLPFLLTLTRAIFSKKKPLHAAAATGEITLG